jgi:hypothetical protein
MEDIKSQLEIDPKLELQLAEQGIETPVHPNDNHAAHMKLLAEALQRTKDPKGIIRVQLIKRQTMLMQQQLQQLAPQGGGSPQGGGGKGPRPGAQPAQGRPAQAPPGQINQDNMSQSDPSAFPRKM